MDRLKRQPNEIDPKTPSLDIAKKQNEDVEANGCCRQNSVWKYLRRGRVENPAGEKKVKKFEGRKLENSRKRQQPRRLGTRLFIHLTGPELR